MDLSRRNYAALLLPFKADGEIDEQAYRELVRYYLQDAFVKDGGLIANPEAGEIYYLSRAEKRRVLELTLEEAGGKLPVFSGVFDMATRDCIHIAKDAKAAGADGIFLMPPAGSMDLVTMWNAEKYPEYWLDQIKAIDAAVGMPIITHPSASPTPAWGIGVPGPAAKLICDSVPNIIGWKMTYNYDGIRKMFKIMRGLDRHVSMLCAGGRFFHEFLAHGKFDGTVSGSWNYAMEPMLAHIDAWKRGDQNEALKVWEEGLSELHDYIYGDYSRLHLRYKVAAWLRGLIPHYRMRPPMPSPTQEEIDTIARLLLDAGIEVSSEARKVA